MGKLSTHICFQKSAPMNDSLHAGR